MKYLKVVFLALLALTLCVQAEAQTAAEECEAFYKAGLEKFNSGNYAGYLQDVSEKYQGFSGVVTPFLFADKAAWAGFIMDMKNLRYVNYTQVHPAFRSVAENTVICNSYFIFTTVDANGETSVQNGRQTTVLVKEGGSWKIANDHFSAAFD